MASSGTSRYTPDAMPDDAHVLPLLPIPHAWYRAEVFSDGQKPLRIDTPQGYSSVEHFRQTISRRICFPSAPMAQI
jgi:hypothetical protein